MADEQIKKGFWYWVKSLCIYGTIQNAFMITGYSGINPEPNLIDRLPPSTFSSSPDPLAPGIDRNSSYYPARTFVIGLTTGI
jgi:iron complex outermembrane receptor protein